MKKAGEGMQPTIQVQEVKETDRLVPTYNWRAHWLTVNEFSRMMGRAPDTVHWWLRNGTLAEFGIPVYRVCGRRRHLGRVFIQNIY
jgi:hypothetical protein